MMKIDSYLCNNQNIKVILIRNRIQTEGDILKNLDWESNLNKLIIFQ